MINGQTFVADSIFLTEKCMSDAAKESRNVVWAQGIHVRY